MSMRKNDYLLKRAPQPLTVVEAARHRHNTEAQTFTFHRV
jgi:hypothetical protein